MLFLLQILVQITSTKSRAGRWLGRNLGGYAVCRSQQFKLDLGNPSVSEASLRVQGTGNHPPSPAGGTALGSPLVPEGSWAARALSAPKPHSPISVPITSSASRLPALWGAEVPSQRCLPLRRNPDPTLKAKPFIFLLIAPYREKANKK